MLISTFLAPICLIVILGVALSGEFGGNDEEINPAQVSIFSSDQGLVYDKLRQYLADADVSRYATTIYPKTISEFEEGLRSGQTHLGIVIREGAFASLLEGNPGAPLEIIHGTGLNKNMISEAFIQIFENRLEWLNGKLASAGSESDKIGVISNMSTAWDSEGDAVKMTKLTPLTSVEYFSVYVLIMCVSLSGLFFAINYYSEKQQHTLERMLTLPISHGTIILAKMIAYAALGIVQSVVILLFSRLFFQVGWGSSFTVIASIILLTIAISISVVFLLMQFIGHIGGVATAFNALVFVSAFLTGGFYPTPGGTVERIIPFTWNHWAASGLFSTMLQSDSSVIQEYLLILLAYAIAAALAALLSYRFILRTKEL